MGRYAMLFAVVLTANCSTGSDATAPRSGLLTVKIATTGDLPDTNGYLLGFDGAEVRAVEANATLTRDMGTGSHRLALTGLASNCSVAGDNPRSVPIIGGEGTSVTFAVHCPSPEIDYATLRVTTTTTGATPDPNGYRVVLDNQRPEVIGDNGELVYLHTSSGLHRVRLSGLAANCTVVGDNPRSVDVYFYGITGAAFVVSCPAP